MTKPLPSTRILRNLLYCDFDTGCLIWKSRPIWMFSLSGTGGRRGNQVRWNNKYAGRPACWSDGKYYHIRILRKKYKAHRIIFLMAYGWCPLVIDHYDGCSLNNSIENLIISSRSHNMHNCKMNKKNTSGHTGVTMKGGKYRARIKYRGTTRHLGLFQNIDDAIKARRNAEKMFGFNEHHGRRK